MRFLKIYLGTMIIIFILAVFVYAMSFVYVQSVETTMGTDISVLEKTQNENITTFSLFGNKITVDTKKIEENINKADKYLPCEIKCAQNLIGYSNEILENAYNYLLCR